VQTNWEPGKNMTQISPDFEDLKNKNKNKFPDFHDEFQ
jgi:hypothetical protein